ncbi:hypothetical protein ACN27E_03345 [Mycobacterium sp. WMMD1722]|uniref:hypothetical protein n=1 Tax=Mycobacterium sp. WMMD1722 TaxID=3404117 RepID=UPI003BF53A04
MALRDLYFHVVGLTGGVHACLSSHDLPPQRASHRRGLRLEPGKLRGWARDVGPVTVTALRTWYDPLVAHAQAVEQLSDDPALRAAARKAKLLAGVHVENERALIAEAGQATARGDGVKLWGHAAKRSLAAPTRKRQLREVLAQLEAFLADAEQERIERQLAAM